MDAIVFQSVSKVFRSRPALFNWVGKESTEPTVALRDVSLRVPAGSVLALLGPNGSGKTTFLRLISTMLLPDQGSITVQRADTRKDAQRVRACVGFAVAGERSFFPRLTARENLDFFSALDNVRSNARPHRIEMTLARTGLLEESNTLAMKFSAGMYQKLAIARALMKQPAMILLDEPTRSLDVASAREVWKLVRELSAQGTTVVIASHNFEEVVAVANSAAVLQGGELKIHERITGFNAEGVRQLYFEGTGEAATSDVDLLVESCR